MKTSVFAHELNATHGIAVMLLLLLLHDRLLLLQSFVIFVFIGDDILISRQTRLNQYMHSRACPIVYL